MRTFGHVGIPRNFYIGDNSAIQVIIIISAFAIPCSMIKEMVTTQFWINWAGIGAVAPFLKALTDCQIVSHEELLNSNKVWVLKS